MTEPGDDEPTRAVDDAISRARLVVSAEERERLIRLLPRLRRLAALIRVPEAREAESAVVFSALSSPRGRP
jgi:hypothetical protein